MLSVFLVEKVVLLFALPQYDFVLLPLIPLFFILFGVGSIKLVYEKKDYKVSSLMAAKMLKLIFSLVIIFGYIFIIKENSQAFLISYIIYFLCYLGFETWMLQNKK
jgi:hypothetical protein